MNTDAKRYYAVLGVSPAASEDDIRIAFRRRAKELHPDAKSGDANAFIRLKLAYDTLIDSEHRAAYDRACQPPSRPSPAAPRRSPQYRTMRPMPPPPRAKPVRRGGVGFVRYAIAFLIMAAISLGGIQAMISLTEAPPSIQTRSTAGRSDSASDAASVSSTEPSTAPGSSKSGFWDATPAATGKKTP